MSKDKDDIGNSGVVTLTYEREAYVYVGRDTGSSEWDFNIKNRGATMNV